MDPITIGLLAAAGYFGYRWYKKHKFHWLYVDPESAVAAIYYKGVVAPTGARGLAKPGDYITTVVKFSSDEADETNPVGTPTTLDYKSADADTTAQVLWQVVENGPVTYKVKFAKILNSAGQAATDALAGITVVPMKYVGTILAKATVEGSQDPAKKG